MIGYCEDKKFREHSHQLIERCLRGGVTLVISAVVVNELKRAPQAVQDVLVVLSTDHVEVIPITEEVRELADCYLEIGALGEGMRADARHIAAATVAGVDVLASWNYRHIVNLLRSRRYDEMNRRMGYPAIEICSPRELENGG